MRERDERREVVEREARDGERFVAGEAAPLGQERVFSGGKCVHRDRT
jgi:hypothetical protein